MVGSAVHSVGREGLREGRKGEHEHAVDDGAVLAVGQPSARLQPFVVRVQNGVQARHGAVRMPLVLMVVV